MCGFPPSHSYFSPIPPALTVMPSRARKTRPQKQRESRQSLRLPLSNSTKGLFARIIDAAAEPRAEYCERKMAKDAVQLHGPAGPTKIDNPLASFSSHRIERTRRAKVASATLRLS